ASVLPDRPQPPPVAGGLHAASVWILPRIADFAVVVYACEVSGSVDRLDFSAARTEVSVFAFAAAFFRLSVRGLPPALEFVREVAVLWHVAPILSVGSKKT